MKLASPFSSITWRSDQHKRQERLHCSYYLSINNFDVLKTPVPQCAVFKVFSVRELLYLPSTDHLPIFSFFPRELRNGTTSNSNREAPIAEQASHECNNCRSMAHQHDYFMLGVNPFQMWDEDRDVSIHTIMDFLNIFPSSGRIPYC